MPASQLPAAARELLGAEVEPLTGGWSGETFAVGLAGERAVLRLYVRRPQRAAVDAALLSRLAPVLPVPPVRAGLSADWLAVGRALDVFALVELAGRSEENPVATAALRLLEASVRAGDLAASRADPTSGRTD